MQESSSADTIANDENTMIEIGRITEELWRMRDATKVELHSIRVQSNRDRTVHVEIVLHEGLILRHHQVGADPNVSLSSGSLARLLCVILSSIRVIRFRLDSTYHN